MKIIVDADACPKTVLQICKDLGQKYGVPVVTVASFEHRIDFENHVVVGNSPQETDIKLMNLSSPGDIAVTRDWGLAAMLLGKGVYCLSPEGRKYDHGKMDFLLEERHIKQKYRAGGGRTRGPRKRTAEQDRRFAAALERLLSTILREPE